jgi:hypothetical protein
MLGSVEDNHASRTSSSVVVDEQEALMLSATREDLEKLLPAGSARRFAELLWSPRAEANARYGLRWTELRHGSLGVAVAQLREASKYYERHVLAWYALGRVAEARSAREAIGRCRRALVAQLTHNGPPCSSPRRKPIMSSVRRGVGARAPNAPS